MKKTLMIIGVAVLVVIVAGMLAFQSGLIGNTNRAANGTQEIDPRDLIVYVCQTSTPDENDVNYNICITSKDGRVQRQLTFDQYGAEISSPQINSHGQIVYRCDTHVCVVNFDGSGKKEFEFSDYFVSPRDLNDEGFVVAGCYNFTVPLAEVCSFRVDGTEFRVYTDLVHEHEDLGAIWYLGGRAMNSQGQIVFNCVNQFSVDPGVCLINLAGEILWYKQDDWYKRDDRPMEDDENILSAGNAVINDDGLIAFSCYRWYICRVRVGSLSGTEKVAYGRRNISLIAMNQSGTIVFQCGGHLCVLSPNTNTVVSLPPDEQAIGHGGVSIDNNDIILSTCVGADYPRTFCLMKSDGSNRSRLELQFPLAELEFALQSFDFVK